MDAIRVNIRRPTMVGALLAALLAIPAGNAIAGSASSPQMAATTPAGRTLVLDPEKDTVALQPGQGSIPSAGGSDLRPDSGAPTAAVRVGQGLRFDGAEMMPSEESRPWLIRQ
ncbi:hypothetical protein [Azospirillum sp. B506]|uniref:hypothetical protein n=1 Tax=Azospirillum sp. B506 TaxID=137721 RepID=UPI0005B26FDD|nr:hypothetical protein [Azospirillum sp. B506]